MTTESPNPITQAREALAYAAAYSREPAVQMKAREALEAIRQPVTDCNQLVSSEIPVAAQVHDALVPFCEHEEYEDDGYQFDKLVVRAELKTILDVISPYIRTTGPKRCKHGVWAMDHCYDCEREHKPVSVSLEKCAAEVTRRGRGMGIALTTRHGSEMDNSWQFAKVVLDAAKQQGAQFDVKD